MTESKTKVYPTGMDLDEEMLVALLRDLADEIERGAVPIQGVMTQTEVGGFGDDLDDLPDCSLRVDYHPSHKDIVPEVKFETPDEK